jgi:hypothetical protein
MIYFYSVCGIGLCNHYNGMLKQLNRPGKKLCQSHNGSDWLDGIAKAVLLLVYAAKTLSRSSRMVNTCKLSGQLCGIRDTAKKGLPMALHPMISWSQNTSIFP